MFNQVEIYTQLENKIIKGLQKKLCQKVRELLGDFDLTQEEAEDLILDGIIVITEEDSGSILPSTMTSALLKITDTRTGKFLAFNLMVNTHMSSIKLF